MGNCFTLSVFGKTIEKGERKDCTGSAFYVSDHYLLTCKHVVSALSTNDELVLCHDRSNYTAKLVETAENTDIALLYTETPAKETCIFSLDRVAVVGREAIVHGYPHGSHEEIQRGIIIGDELGKGETVLSNANSVTTGFSGGPVCRASDPKTAVGVLSAIRGEDKYGRQTEVAIFVSARVALELWAEKYVLKEKRYEVSPDSFGSNSFVYSARMTDFQDSNGYIDQLRGFMKDSRSVLWWAVVGQGGSGKSRLCYELARTLNSYWSCKLICAGQLKSNDLQALYEDAGRNILLLVDYAYTDTGELGEWLTERASAVDAKEKPSIRVLLLQRESGRNNIGWMESLLCRHRNLIKIRYQEDLQLVAPGREETIALMHSYAKNMGGRKIDIEVLYTVLQGIDPGLTRPLYAMFITDAALRGDNPREWDREDALAYFTRREKDVIDRALGVSEEINASKLLLVLSTIANGFTFDATLLNSSPLLKLQEFIELQDINHFGSKLKKAGLADWGNGSKYIMKPLRPDLLGEFFVLESFREIMDDPQRKEDIPVLLDAAMKADIEATVSFLKRLFTDYDAEESLARVCCGKNIVLQNSISWGLAIRQNVVLLRKLYESYKTDLWFGQCARGLAIAIVNQTDAGKVDVLLEELRGLHEEDRGNIWVTVMLAIGLSNAIDNQTDTGKAEVLLDELRRLHEEDKWNSEVTVMLAIGLSNAISNQTDTGKVDVLLEELRGLHEEDRGNSEVTGMLAIGLSNAISNQTDAGKADVLLEELRGLHEEDRGNSEVTGKLARGLSNVIDNQTDAGKADVLLDELRGLHEEDKWNSEVTGKLARGLSIAIVNQTDAGKADVLLEELRGLHEEDRGNSEVTGKLARGLSNVIDNQTDAGKADVLLEELRGLHEEDKWNSEVTGKLARGLSIAIVNQTDAGKVDVLLDELRRLREEDRGNSWVTVMLAIGLSNAIDKQTDTGKADVLLEELRRLHEEDRGNSEVTGRLAIGLANAIDNQTDAGKVDVLLEELRGLHEKDRGNSEVTGMLAGGLSLAIDNQIDAKKANNLLDELRGLHEEDRGNSWVTEMLAGELANAIDNQIDAKKADVLLDELRRLHEEDRGNSEVTGRLAIGLFHVFSLHLVYVFSHQTDAEKLDALLEELRGLHEEDRGNSEVTERLVLVQAMQLSIRQTKRKPNVLLDELRGLHEETEEPLSDC